MHTGSIDASCTIIGAWEGVLEDKLPILAGRALEAVVDDLEQYNESVVPDVGIGQ